MVICLICVSSTCRRSSSRGGSRTSAEGDPKNNTCSLFRLGGVFSRSVNVIIAITILYNITMLLFDLEGDPKQQQHICLNMNIETTLLN